MGLLDALFSGDSGSGGGLLDFLRQNGLNQNTNTGIGSNDAGYAQGGMQSPLASMQQPSPIFAPQQPSPLDGAQWPAGPIGAPMQANAQMPPASPLASAVPPAPIASPPQNIAPAPAPASPFGGAAGFFNRLGDGLQSVAQGGSLQGAITGNYTDSKTQAANVANVTARALIANGVDPQIAIAAVQPGNAEFLKTLVTQNFGQAPHSQETDKDGNVWDVNTQTGQRTIALAAKDDKFQHVQVGESGLGQKSYGTFNTKTGETKPDAGNAPASDGLGDMSKTGPEYLATVPKAQAGIMQGMVDGTIQPPSSFALAKPYWQAMLAGAKTLDPNFDANTWTSRHKMSSDIGASGNSSMGGILSNGKSSFKHLAEYTESAADLGNASHDFPGGGIVAHAQNYIGNTLGGSDTNAKIKAINDNLGHYGQESTKFYAGTGGGVEERMNALKEMNPTTTSSEEMAAYASKEKGLMLDRLREKEAQIRDVMGDAFLQKHPVFTPELQKDIARIDANVGKLRGQKAAPAAAASAPAPGAYTWTPNGGLAGK